MTEFNIAIAEKRHEPYSRPEMTVVRLEHWHGLLAGSQTEGLNDKLLEEEVDEGW